jgi:hypothetical protein
MIDFRRDYRKEESGLEKRLRGVCTLYVAKHWQPASDEELHQKVEELVGKMLDTYRAKKKDA